MKLPKMESNRVGGPCIEHAANTKPNLPCFRQPSLTEELIRIEHGWMSLSTRNLGTRYTRSHAYLRVDQSHISCPPSQTHRRQLRHAFTCKWTRAHSASTRDCHRYAICHMAMDFDRWRVGIDAFDLHCASNQQRQTGLDIMVHVPMERRPSRH